MKKPAKLLSLLLCVMMLLSMMACGNTPVEVAASASVAEATPDAEAPTASAPSSEKPTVDGPATEASVAEPPVEEASVTAPAEVQETSPASDPEPTTTYDLETLISDETYTASTSYGREYDIRYPRINLYSEEITQFNVMIRDEYCALGPMAMEECYGIDYTCYLNGNILSVVIIKTFVNDNYSYEIVNVNVAEERRASEDELLQACGYQNEDERAAALAETLTDYIVSVQRDFCDRVGQEYDESEISEYIERSTAQENLEAARYFLDEDGHACAASTYYYPAGGGTHNGCFNLVSHERIDY